MAKKTPSPVQARRGSPGRTLILIAALVLAIVAIFLIFGVFPAGKA
ncbi:MAG: hypothetical protein Kilf2KO_29450 [Rhodospirillales bacterium]